MPLSKEEVTTAQTISALTTGRKEAHEKIEDLRRQLQDAEAQMAVTESSDVLHSMSGESGDETGAIALY